MPDEVKACKFYHFLKCGEVNCCECAYYPFRQNDREFMPGSERAKLAESCVVWLRAHSLPATTENVIEALFQNNAINAPHARAMIAANPPALSDTLGRVRV